ncbi:MAG TPA: tRNA (adenosine(37)-N6)-dimethylallyltransferase MiaA [Chthoniobacterales bacterium]|nr:tRNA (adenosine(37)-N6)-dimethylallyltransferase MiaA [Chthoniobacterales bacterium]
MSRVFYIVGPTAVGKSEIAAAVAREAEGEIVSADAFQIYSGLDLLSAKPQPAELAAVPHHLLGVVPLSETMDAERFRALALAAIAGIQARGKPALVVGGSGLYLKALTDGLSPLPKASVGLRARLEQLSEMELFVRLARLDPGSARVIDRQNKRRLIRAVEICLLTGLPASEQRQRAPVAAPPGVLLGRDRAELYQRIDVRVETMFAQGVVEEVRRAGEVGPTAGQMLGWSQIRALIAGRISEAACIAALQQATRRYAKRQLTWFQRQTSFEPLNLSRTGSSEAVSWIARQARLAFAQNA